MTRSPCAWCRGPVVSRRRDAIYCGKVCRQAAHRAKVDRLELEATDRPLRLAYADPPYIGRARRYYGREASYAGEVDHSELVARLATFDGWALSCAADSIPGLFVTVAEVLRDVSRGDRVRLAIWHRRRPPHPTAARLSAYEGVIYSPARFVVPGPARPTTDVLLGVEGRPRPTLPGSVIGMKPPAFCVWLFQLLGAMPGDELVDLFPGSGMVGRSWAAYTAPGGQIRSDTVNLARPGSRDTSRVDERDTSRPAARDTSRAPELDTSRPTSVDTSRAAAANVSPGGSARQLAAT